MKRLFLSFSVTGDAEGRDFVRRLFARLGQQTIEPWIFESPGGQIRTGASISVACRRKIEEADIFVVFITDQALESDYVDIEVSHALWESTRRSMPVVPLVATAIHKSRWPRALAEMTGFSGVFLRAPLVDAIEGIVTSVCGVLGLDYVPPRPISPRLPLAQRLTEELRARSSTTYDIGDFGLLLRKCDLVIDAFGVEDYERARQLLESVRIDLELQYGLAKSYYPRIVYGAALLGEAYAGARSFAEAERFFSELIAESSERLDASAFTGRANALMGLERFHDALIDYMAAERYLDAPDPAVVHNFVRAHVLAGLSLDPDDMATRRAALTGGIIARAPGDLARLTSIIAVSYAYMGDSSIALELWHQNGDVTDVFPEVVTEFCDQLHRCALASGMRWEDEAALDVLREFAAARCDLAPPALLPIRHMTARLLSETGQRERARVLFDQLTSSFPLSPIVRVDAAMYALADGDVHRARQMCEAVTVLQDASQCSPPHSFQEFNLAVGQAFWLLGRSTEAAESFRRSRQPSAQWYGSTMPGQFGAAFSPPRTTFIDSSA